MASSRVLSAQDPALNSRAVLWTYRQLLRATFIAFKGDYNTLYASRQQARESFQKGRDLRPGSIEAAQSLEHAQAVTQILKENVVQGRQVAGKNDQYKLNIHEHTQRLDNDTAGTLKGTTKSFSEVKAATF